METFAKFSRAGEEFGFLVLISLGGKLLEGGNEGDFVLVMAEGKQHALAIGRLNMCSDDM